MTVFFVDTSFVLALELADDQHHDLTRDYWKILASSKPNLVTTSSVFKAEALRQSILKQAFEGKLVPKDPNDEPAEKLLERIWVEKTKRQPAGKQLTIKMNRSKEDANDLED